MKNGDIYLINDCLKKIAKDIQKIEDENPEYQLDKNWKLMRAKQDYLYYLKQQIENKKTEEKTNA